MTSRSLRWGALAGTAFVVAATFGVQMANGGLVNGNDDASALADVRHVSTAQNRVGYVLAVLGFSCLFFFVGALYRILRRAERADGWLAGTALVAGTALIALKLGSAAFEIAARYHPATVSATAAGIYDNLGNGAFVMSGLFAAIFVLAASLSALGSRALPRWLAWAGVVVGVAGMVTPSLAFHQPTAYNPAPWLLAMLWMAVVGIVLFRRTKPAGVDDARDGAGGSAVNDRAATTVAARVRASA